MLIEILVTGPDDAKSPKINDQCKVTYKGTLIDGCRFDAGTANFSPDQVIAGWTEALQLMGEGDKWRLYTPYNMAYGANGDGIMIPGYATLIFEIQLHKVLTTGKSVSEARMMLEKAQAISSS